MRLIVGEITIAVFPSYNGGTIKQMLFPLPVGCIITLSLPATVAAMALICQKRRLAIPNFFAASPLITVTCCSETTLLTTPKKICKSIVV